MKDSRRYRLGVERAVLVGLMLGGVVSAGMILRKIAIGKDRLVVCDGLAPKYKGPIEKMNFQALDAAISSMMRPAQSEKAHLGLFASELRVVAIGSAYPIPYDAEICPFSKMPQPEMNQLDRDGDGITDDWELRYGLDKYKVSDAAEDLDGDGFSNFAEFVADTDPKDSALHPPYATQLRFVERKKVPFPFVFQGVTKLSDGSTIFQINDPASGKTYFSSIGEEVEGVVLQFFMPRSRGEKARLFVMRGGDEVELIRGEIAADPESQALLINILDHSTITATIGALLYLRNDEYIVLGVYRDKVVVKHLETGDVFDITGLADGER